MNYTVRIALCTLSVLGGGLAYGQRDYNDYGRDRGTSSRYNDRDYRYERRDSRDYRSDDRRDQREFRYDDRNYNRNSNSRDVLNAYREGFRDGQRETERFYRQRMEFDEQSEREQRRNDKPDYKNFTFGVYAGANSTRFEGEDVDGNALAGRLGWQLGGFIRGGGRVFGQIGFEYLTSSNDFYQKGDGANVEDITGNIDQRYIHVPAYIGIKLAQSPKGVSAVRLQLGAQYASPTGVRNNDFNIDRNSFRRSTFMGLANLGFDAGPLFLDLVYQHGFEDVLKESNNSKRRVVGVNVGLKF